MNDNDLPLTIPGDLIVYKNGVPVPLKQGMTLNTDKGYAEWLKKQPLATATKLKFTKPR